MCVFLVRSETAARRTAAAAQVAAGGVLLAVLLSPQTQLLLLGAPYPELAHFSVVAYLGFGKTAVLAEYDVET